MNRLPESKEGPAPREFRYFINLLLETAPEGYEPWLFRCGKESKAPATEFGSWKDEKNRLDVNEAVEWMEDGGNVGIAGMDGDSLVNVDIDDDDETDVSQIKTTLRARSRSRYGRHAWYYAKNNQDIPNIPTEDKGEVRANGQYVLAPGSYVPTDPADVPEGQGQVAGYYTVEVAEAPAEITIEELPDVFQRQLRKAEQESKQKNNESFETVESDSQSALFEITATDVARREGASTNPSDRWESAFHGSTTGENMSLSNQGRIQCWRHGVAHGGLQALVALSDHPDGCGDIGTAHSGSNAGASSIKGDDSAIWYAWKYAKKNGYIPQDDPVPYRALKHICRARGLCPVTDIPTNYNPEEGERIPDYAYNAALATIRENDGLEPGRETTENIDDGNETAADGGVAAASPPNDPSPDPSDGGSDDIKDKFTSACQYYHVEPEQISTQPDGNGGTTVIGVEQLQMGNGIDDAVLLFNREADLIDGTDKQAIIGRVVYLDLQEYGEFFKTADGRLYYFHEPEREVYRVDASGRRILTEEFQGFAWERYNLFAGQFSRNLGEDIRSQAAREAQEKEVYQFAHYNNDTDELYLSDWDSGYYCVSADGIEWRANGTDVFFLSDDFATGYDYIEPEDRPELPNKIPGERDIWQGAGDPLMRLFGNRINYSESAALGPSEQRKQLYLHMHTLPFIDLLNSRPITAWVGEKGSGKTVIERSVGRFIYGEEYTESIMPDDKDDFLAKVTNQALAFVDNYDDEVDWANDVLAAIATGAGLDKRELYTTNTLRREQPRCWLSVTSRDAPFRRDDVADRTLVFRVNRVEDGFVGMGDFLRQVSDYRDLLWSVYLDNLQEVVEEYTQRDTGTMSSSHRMADWAIFAKIVADALDVEGIDQLLETMETERAVFALENEDWAAVIGDWINSDPDDAATWRKASSLSNRLSEKAEEFDRPWPAQFSSAKALGSKLSQYHSELGELYDLEIDDSGKVNKYRFNPGDGAGEATGLDRF